MSRSYDSVVSLQTTLMDASEGYAEGAGLTEDATIASLFRSLKDLHDQHIAQITHSLAAHGIAPADDTSMMALVHKAVLNIRSFVTGLRENIIPAIIDGEERIIGDYDDTVAALPEEDELQALLILQANALREQLITLRQLEADKPD